MKLNDFKVFFVGFCWLYDSWFDSHHPSWILKFAGLIRYTKLVHIWTNLTAHFGCVFLFPDKAAGTKQINVFMRGIYSNDVLMESSVGSQLATALRDFIRAYLWQAWKASELGLQYFGLYPKLHSLHEIAYGLRRQARISPWVFNPAACSCSLDEDFIGRVAVISRQVSPRLIPMRTIQRYLAHINIAWSRVYPGQEI